MNNLKQRENVYLGKHRLTKQENLGWLSDMGWHLRQWLHDSTESEVYWVTNEALFYEDVIQRRITSLTGIDDK